VIGDLEEAHRSRIDRRGHVVGAVLTSLEALDVARAFLVVAVFRRGPSISLLDFKLGARMLIRYPGLTVVGALAMAFAIWVGAGTFEILYQVVRPSVPLDEGDRIVGIRVVNVATSDGELRLLSDLATWRAGLGSVQELGAFRAVQRNLVVPGGVPEPARIAEVSSEAFGVTRVPPLLGRVLVEADERPGSPPVLVVGYDVWRSRFGGAADVVGRIVRVGDEPATVVGVMPEGFAFPVSDDLWMPLTSEIYEPLAGPPVRVFGRLAPGASLEQAQTELAVLAERASADHPDTHEFLRPRILPYARSILYLPDWIITLLPLYNALPLMLLVVLCGNVALLVFARAATRESELAVRSALGAGRGRIVAQLFAEALVLGGLAAVIGLAAANGGLRWAFALLEGEVFGDPGEAVLPFWLRPRLSPLTIGFAALLTLVAAGVAGVLPALKATRGVSARLKAATAGGGGMQLGGVWTLVIIGQVALTVVLPPMTWLLRDEGARVTSRDVGFASEEYLTARLELDRDPAAGDTTPASVEDRFRSATEELRRRLEAEPAVIGVTFAQALPRMSHGRSSIEIGEAADTTSHRARRARSTRVAVDYFDVLGVPVLAGRAFDSGDLSDDASVVVVNEPFVEEILGGRNPIGRRLQIVGSVNGGAPADRAWYEIVGVVPELGMTHDVLKAGFYRPAAPGGTQPTHLVVHTRDDPVSLASELRATASAVDRSLQLHELVPLDDVTRRDAEFYRFWIILLGTVTGLTLLLALAGIYAVMSFRVSRRTREIGVRVALGADGARIVPQILGRPLAHVAIGLVVGTGLAAGMLFNLSFGPDVKVGFTPARAAAIGIYALLMMCVCATACVVPTRRALAVQPSEALRADG
jgi:predicted permease